MDHGKDFCDLDGITNAEFRDQIKHWIEEQGIHANLQLQMKKDLIDQISRTALGRKINLKLQTHHGIVLSPLVLVLNTLVAEFLYVQNCHYTLSVFSNEVPFKNTLPDFTKSAHFRLDRVELREIFEALGIDHHAGLVEKYESKGSEAGKSLLYIIFKSMLAAVRGCEERIRGYKKEECDREKTKGMLDGLEVERLHRNVEKLLVRVRVVGKSIEKLEETQRNNENNVGNCEEETTSLRACTENVEKFVGRLETCSKTFEDLIVKLQAQVEEQTKDEKKEVPEKEVKPEQEEQKKSYTDFLNELKTTEYGKKYVAKLQKQIVKLMGKEKALIEAACEKKLHEAELEYKRKLESYLSDRVRELSVPRERSPKLTVTKSSDGEESVHFMKKIDEKLNQLYQHERNVDEKLVSLRGDLQKHEQRQSAYFQSLKSAETKEKKLLVLQDVERQLLSTFEDETQAIIRNAKATIDRLEGESDKINRSFQQYLHKQREDKRKLNDEKIEIWQRYNDEKLELNQRELMATKGDVSVEVPIVHERYAPHRESFPDPAQFENPFRNFDPHKYLRRPKVCNVVLETAKDVVDVAVNTSIEPVIPKEVQPVDPKLSDLLAKDTLNLKRSIEENLQKLDQMSKTYSKSTSSSSGTAAPAADKQGTYNVDKSLDDLSSIVEIEVAEGNDKAAPDLDSTKELLEFARKNFSGEKETPAKKDSLDLGSLGSLSDLDVSEDGSGSNHGGKQDSLGDIVEQISTGKRSLSDGSWN
ncbi:ankyrin repeat domain-containing protein 26 [Culex pipiens pallens]|uniref:ankyrin repeat domain-containing protein 26 n=1 Tax=Culex pipiens pallens TaxID=42434 RepID=UPI001952EFC0|nr:ankyrin repeat domain-containing protein 26 [Culex pipiens pallens]